MAWPQRASNRRRSSEEAARERGRGMNILIEFQDCSLEIGHIGTRIELFMEAVTEMATQILEGLHKIFDSLIKVISDLWDRLPTEMKKLAEEEGGEDGA
jgi:hypothetical protein